ncbi:hypothetical protein L596_028798 [Steinernema carpocapsae]|uniref:Uncharacterized protein n=1 Tax=Steinernema carpocapsae TaxID=34508 RepID=A0A4U5LZE7_STECR|nr:hypothetical protein L596_028798 [Steinernema carpocapsae]
MSPRSLRSALLKRRGEASMLVKAEAKAKIRPNGAFTPFTVACFPKKTKASTSRNPSRVVQKTLVRQKANASPALAETPKESDSLKDLIDLAIFTYFFKKKHCLHVIDLFDDARRVELKQRYDSGNQPSLEEMLTVYKQETQRGRAPEVEGVWKCKRCRATIRGFNKGQVQKQHVTKHVLFKIPCDVKACQKKSVSPEAFRRHLKVDHKRCLDDLTPTFYNQLYTKVAEIYKKKCEEMIHKCFPKS